MHIPAEILDLNGDPGFGTIYLRGGSGEVLKEYGQVGDGVNRSCYVLTSTDDTIVVHYALKPGVADFVDLQVDGIVRESQSHSTSKPEKEFKNSFKQVWHKERNGKGILGGIKNCTMKVVLRAQEHDKVNGPGPFSDVGSLKLLLIRSKTDESPDNSTEKSGEALDASGNGPMYDEYANWWELNPNIDPNTIASPFEVELVDRKQLAAKTKERATTKRDGNFEIVGILKFLLSSTSDLRARGFSNIPEYQATPVLENSPQPQPGTKATPTPKMPRDALSIEENESPKPAAKQKVTPGRKMTPASRMTPASKRTKALPVDIDQDDDIVDAVLSEEQLSDTSDSITVWSSEPQSKLFGSVTQSSTEEVGPKSSLDKAATKTHKKTIKSETLEHNALAAVKSHKNASSTPPKKDGAPVQNPRSEKEPRAMTPFLGNNTVASPRGSPIAADRSIPSTPSTANRRIRVEIPRALSPPRMELNGPLKNSLGNSLLAKVSLASVHKKDRSPTNFDNSVKSTSSAVTESSPTPTETPTEVATEEEIEALCQRASQAASNSSQLAASANLQNPDHSLKEKGKSAAASDRENRSDDSENPSVPPTQTRLHSQSRSGSNELSSSVRPMISNGSIPTSPTPRSRQKTPKQPNFGTATKRKADSVDGGDVFAERPYKKQIPSIPKSPPETQRKFSAAQERLAAAERQREKLLEQLETAKQVKEANELNQKAEKLEQENAELEAMIADMYASD